jgi:hypothetical protein
MRIILKLLIVSNAFLGGRGPLFAQLSISYLFNLLVVAETGSLPMPKILYP